MCGIAGIFDPRAVAGAGVTQAATRMGAALAARGPDGDGVWSDPDYPLALAHRRLSIIDLTAAGAQPMISECGRYVITYNGELYNYRLLRRQLQESGHAARGASDTEVVLAACSTWGIEKFLARASGMFALALWDRDAQRLTLARDPMGEKPLYYGWWQERFLFASDLAAFAALDGFAPAVDRTALAQLLRHNYVPDPHCIYTGFSKLAAGMSLCVDVRNDPHVLLPRPYWSLRSVIARSRDASVARSDDEAIAQLDDVLSRAVSRQCVADVPLGALLSGGIDSSTIVALMQAQSITPVKTFSIGFDIQGYDEAPYARAVAQHLGTEHTEFYVTADDALKVIPELPVIYSEPFADASQIPTVLVARLARQHVTVAMTGDAGDELFAGYLRYTTAMSLWQRVGATPAWMRALAAQLIKGLSPATWERGMRAVNPLLPARHRYQNAGEKLHKVAHVLAADDPMHLYLSLISLWQDPGQVVRGAELDAGSAVLPNSAWLGDDWVSRMMYCDSMQYLPGDILVKVDRAAMSAGLETRVPFLSPEVIEFAWQVPFTQKVRNGQGKWLLRRLLERYLPAALFERPKMGFGVPIDSWLRGPLRPWADDLLSPARLQSAGYFDPTMVTAAWQAHLTGQQNLQYPLWGVLMFEAWRERWVA